VTVAGTDIKTSGPFFDGSLEDDIERSIDEINDEVGQQGVNLIRQRLHSVLQHPTGRYEGAIQTERRSDTNLITDGGIVYGGWLEGTSSRNNASRFKGYSTFRKMAPEIEQLSQKIAEQVIEQRIGGM
jgi:hypothetical protein